MKRALMLLFGITMLTASAVGDVTSGLVAWYKFDGNLSDASGNGYDMAGTCGGYVQGQGLGGQALSCAGSTAVCPAKRIEVEASFTISCWLKSNEDIAVVSESSSGTRYNGKMVLVPGQCGTYGSMSGAGVGFAYGKNGVAVYEHGGSYLPVVLMHSANVGTGWNHVVITVSNDNAPMLYINGDFVRQGVKGARTHRCVMLGKDCSTIGGEFYGNRFTGCTDDFRIYNRALSAAEVRALFLNNCMRIKLYVDDKDYIKIKNGEIWLEHKAREVAPGLYTALPGRHGGNNYATYINDESWFPEWGTDEGSSSVDCESGHKSIADVNMPLSRAYVYTIKSLTARNVVKISETPTEQNGNMLSVEIDDGESFGGAAWYEFEIAWKLLDEELCAVTFDAAGGAAGWTKGEVVKGAAIGTLPTATRSGYVFDGWYTLPSGGDRVMSSTAVTGDIVLYAHWRQAAAMLVKMNSFRQRYPWNGLVDVDCEVSIGEDSGYKVGLEVVDDEAGTNLAVKTLWVVGGEETNKYVSVHSGVQRLVWNADADLPDGFKCKMGRARLRLAKQVEFDVVGGQCDERAKTFVLGEPYGALPIPTRSGYQFVGWCAAAYDGARIDAESIADPAISVLTAKWEVR